MDKCICYEWTQLQHKKGAKYEFFLRIMANSDYANFGQWPEVPPGFRDFVPGAVRGVPPFNDPDFQGVYEHYAVSNENNTHFNRSYDPETFGIFFWFLQRAIWQASTPSSPGAGAGGGQVPVFFFFGIGSVSLFLPPCVLTAKFSRPPRTVCWFS
jgi:hypothetical protein